MTFEVVKDVQARQVSKSNKTGSIERAQRADRLSWCGCGALGEGG